MIYVTFLLISLLLLGVYRLSNNDFFSPGMIYIESFWLATLMATINNNDWGIRYGFDFLIYVIGTAIVFSLVSHLTKSLKIRINFLGTLLRKEKKYKVVIIHPNWWVFVVLLAVSIISIYIYMNEVRHIASALGSKSLADMFYIYHNKYLLASEDTGLRVSSIASLLNRINMALGYYFSYVFCNNVIRFKERIRKNIKYLVFLLLYVISLFIGSQRTGVVYILFAIMFIGFVMGRQRKAWKNGNGSSIKIIRYGMLGLVSVAFGLRWAGELMGRTNEQSVFSYFAGYLGGGIPNLSRFLQEHSIKLVGMTDGAADASSFWSYSGVRCNLSTWISNVGNLGIIPFFIYVMVVSFLYAEIYYSYIYKKPQNAFSDFWIVLFGYAGQGLLFVGLTDIIISHMVTVGFVIFGILIYLLNKFCRKFNRVKDFV